MPSRMKKDPRLVGKKRQHTKYLKIRQHGEDEQLVHDFLIDTEIDPQSRIFTTITIFQGILTTGTVYDLGVFKIVWGQKGAWYDMASRWAVAVRENRLVFFHEYTEDDDEALVEAIPTQKTWRELREKYNS